MRLKLLPKKRQEEEEPKTTKMAAARSSFVWTDEEVELLLRVTLEYKSSKHREDIDWESSQTKYADIHEAFVRRYPAGQRLEFPHSTEATSRVQLTSKLKAIRGKFRQAVDSGRRHGHGRVVLRYFELCKQIWDGSADTDGLESGLETGDVQGSLGRRMAAMTPRVSPVLESVGDGGCLSNQNIGSDVNTRRNTRQAKFAGHRRDRLKRKVHSDPAVQEDLQIKRRMLELLEESEKHNKAKLDNLSVQMDKMIDSIDEGMSLLRTLMCQSQNNSQRPDGSSSIDTDVHIPSSGLKIEIQAADHCYAGHEEVGCDVCTGRKLKAFKFCLVCLMNYCVKHLQPHCDAATLKVHKLVNPSKKRQQIHQKIQDQEKDVKLLHQEVEAINVSADKAVEDSEEIFTQLIRLLQERSSEVKQQIRSQQETEVSRVKDVEEKLEQEISELKRKDAELEQLSHTEDHNQFLLNYPSLPALSESTHSSSINIRPLRHFEDVTAAVTELKDIMLDVLRDSWTNISLRVTGVDVLLREPKTRDGFLHHSKEITLDPNTANRNLFLSEGNRKVIRMMQHQFYPDNPDRFTDYKQVLSRESLTGCCYWEVNWTGRGVGVAVSYKNIRRSEGFGFNDMSWSLYCTKDGNTFFLDDIETPVPGPVSSRVGVYLDHRAGILCFYSVSETMTLLHRVQTRFTQPLHAGICVYNGSSAELIKPQQSVVT